MTETDGNRDGRDGDDRVVPAVPGSLVPRWPSLREPHGNTGDTRGGSARGDAAAPDRGAASDRSAASDRAPAPDRSAGRGVDGGRAGTPYPTRRALRTGAIPVVTAGATGAAGAGAAEAGAAGAGVAGAGAAAGAASAGDGAVPGRRTAWTHPALEGRDPETLDPRARPVVGGAVGSDEPTTVLGTADELRAAGGGTGGDPLAAGGGSGGDPLAAASGPVGSPPASAGAREPEAGGRAGRPGAVSADAAARGASDDGPSRRDVAGTRRRRWPWVVAVLLVLAVIGGAVAFLVLRDGDQGGGGSAAPDVVLPSPTTTVAPVARTATTPFASALPTTVLQYALASSADDADWLGRGALEAYTETYTDGAGAQVTVQSGQWATPEEAEAVRAALAAELPAGAASAGAAGAGGADPGATPAGTATAGAPGGVLEDGEVRVGDAVTGTVTVVDAGDGTGVALWSNGTVVLRVAGPVADVRNLYAAFPL